MTGQQTKTINDWLASGKYLPKPLRDFHDQKAVFKTIDYFIKEKENSTVKRPDWIAAHCYVIDVFLWFMARRGYTLQKTKTRLDFRDLEVDVGIYQQKEMDSVMLAMSSKFQQ